MSTLTHTPGFLNTITSACPLHDHRRRTTLLPPDGSRRLSRVSCNQKAGSGGDAPRPSSPLLMDRREVLVALGGMYGAAGKMALAGPLEPPNLSTCHLATSEGVDPELLKCCPPYSSAEIVEYNFPKTTLRVRRPAHLVINDEEYMEKYKAAVDAMKKLDKHDPWNYNQQAKIHCAYCNDAYPQKKYPDVTLQVHASWIFLPWHRYYLHFYERILGKLIDDDTFALPYWNFDSPDGMVFPSIFADSTTTLYDANRNPDHMPPAVLDYQYSYTKGDREIPDEQKITENVAELRSVFKNSLSLPELFMGDPLRAGQQFDATGRLENIHNAIHMWVGTTEMPHYDMGNFATSGYDSAFYTLHTNVDRLWHIYRTLRGNKVEFNDPDWLDSTFIFYDENRQVVKIKVRDSFNTSKFCYTYDEVPIPWLGKVARVRKYRN